MKMYQTNWLLPSKVEHAFLIVAADRQQRNALAVHNCVLAFQSPLTGSCSGVQSSPRLKELAVYRTVYSWQGECIVGASLLLCRSPAGSSSVAVQGRSHKVS